jgi:hypothetical protein
MWDSEKVVEVVASASQQGGNTNRYKYYREEQSEKPFCGEGAKEAYKHNRDRL